MDVTKINRHGQVSIPARIRKQLGLKVGDLMGVEAVTEGKVLLFPAQLSKKDPWEDLKKYEDRGVDLTLLWENLKRSPTARVERHQEMLALVDEARQSGRKLRGQI